jgi:hypothetical protein
VDHHEAAPAQVAGIGQRDRQRETHGDGRIDGIPARLQHLKPGLAGQCLFGCHHPTYLPDNKDVDQAFQRMTQMIKYGTIGSLLAFDRAGEPIMFGAA